MRSLRSTLQCCGLPIKPLVRVRVSTHRQSISQRIFSTTAVMASDQPKDEYQKWTKVGLIARIKELEHQISSGNTQSDPTTSVTPSSSSKKRKDTFSLDPSDYHTRPIALKIAYLGRRYGGFEYASGASLPTVEEELFKALVSTCLILGKDQHIIDFSGLDYSKCGRTDRGVSAFGQVIGLRVRSARPVAGKLRKRLEKKKAKALAAGKPAPEEMTEDEIKAQEAAEQAAFDSIRDEHPYCKMLNRVLPRDIRVLAWAPEPPADFSARFSCQGREYRYFFTQPAFNPPSDGDKDQPHSGWLDIEAMRDAAKRFEGEHDFRNFCKVDPAKNISSYHRLVREADIYEVDDMSSNIPHLPSNPFNPPGAVQGPQPKVYYFRVRGTAFLWHQIRHMISILFSVGQGVEKPSLVDELLDIESNPRRPQYPMADEVPLVLWDCTFPDDLKWLHADETHPSVTGRNPTMNAPLFKSVDEMWRMWREIKMDEILVNGLMRLTAENYTSSNLEGLTSTDKTEVAPVEPRKQDKRKGGGPSLKRFEGGNHARLTGEYVPVMELRQMDTPMEQNDRFAKKKGFADHAAWQKDRENKWLEKMAELEKMDEKEG